MHILRVESGVAAEVVEPEIEIEIDMPQAVEGQGGVEVEGLGRIGTRRACVVLWWGETEIL